MKSANATYQNTQRVGISTQNTNGDCERCTFGYRYIAAICTHHPSQLRQNGSGLEVSNLLQLDIIQPRLSFSPIPAPKGRLGGSEKQVVPKEVL